LRLDEPILLRVKETCEAKGCLGNNHTGQEQSFIRLFLNREPGGGNILHFKLDFFPEKGVKEGKPRSRCKLLPHVSNVFLLEPLDFTIQWGKHDFLFRGLPPLADHAARS